MLLEYTLILHCSFHCSFCKVSLLSLPQISGSFYSRAASTPFAVKQKTIAREIRCEIGGGSFLCFFHVSSFVCIRLI